MKLKHAPAIAKKMKMSNLRGQMVASGALRVKLPMKMKKMLAARIYGIAWMNSGRLSANSN